jgi:hypothetical protein
VSGDGLVAPLNAPAAAIPTPGVQPGTTQPIVIANKVIVFGANGGIFVYSGTPAGGNLIYSIAPSTGTDQVGNNYLAGETSYNNGLATPIAYNLNLGQVTWYTFGGGNPGATFTAVTQINLAREGLGGAYGIGVHNLIDLVNDAAGGSSLIENTALGIISYFTENTAATADNNTYTVGHLILPSTATPSSTQTINSTSAAAITGCTANVAPAAYRVRAEVQYAGDQAAGTPSFQVGLGSGAAATVIWGNARFHDAVAGTSGYVARPTAWSPFAGPTLSTNNWMMSFEGYALFTAGGAIALQAWTSNASDTYEIKNAVLDVFPV